MPQEFVNVGRVSELPEKGGKFIRIDDEEIALFKIEGNVYAICNVCPHQHISALHQGELKGLHLTCPMHGWTYSVDTGRAVNGSGNVATYPVKIVGGNVLVGIARDD